MARKKVARPSADDIREVRAGTGSARDRREVAAYGGLRKLNHKMKPIKKKGKQKK